MKKRILCFALVLVMMFGMAPMAGASRYYDIYATKGAADKIIRTYRSAMAEYDYVINTNADRIVFIDPHEAWNDYITTKHTNNWFTTYFRDHETEIAQRATEQNCGRPNNLTQNTNGVTEWWEQIDSYISIVHPDGHTVDPNRITNDAIDKTQKTHTEKDKTWATWWSLKYAEKKNQLPELSPWFGLTYQEWEDYLTNMSEEESTLFWEYWNRLVGVCDREIWGTGITFEQWKETKTPNNQSTTVSPTISTHAMAPTTNSTDKCYNPMPLHSDMAYASTQIVTINGNPIEFQCYALKDNNGNLTNFIKLRDIALTLNDTNIGFSIYWEDGSLSIFSPSRYRPNGSEMHTPFSGDRICEHNRQSSLVVNSLVNGAESILLTDDNGGGYTYYKIRDLGKIFDFNVGWSADTGMFIETDKPYDPNN